MSLLLEALKKAALNKRDRAEKEGDVGIDATHADKKLPVTSEQGRNEESRPHNAGQGALKAANTKSARDEWLARKDPSKKDISTKGSENISALAIESHEPDGTETIPTGAIEGDPAKESPVTESPEIESPLEKGDIETAAGGGSPDWSDPFPDPEDLDAGLETGSETGKEDDDSEVTAPTESRKSDIDQVNERSGDETVNRVVENPSALELELESEGIEIVHDSAGANLGVDLDLDLHLELEKGLDLEEEAKAKAEASRSAMAELLAQSQEVVAKTRRRGIVLYAALFLTSFGSIGAYYYYLTLNNYSVGIPRLSDAEESQILQNQKDIRLKRMRKNSTALSEENNSAARSVVGEQVGDIESLTVETSETLVSDADGVEDEMQSIESQSSVQTRTPPAQQAPGPSLPEVVIFQNLGTPAQLEMMTRSGLQQNAGPVTLEDALADGRTEDPGLLGTRVISHQKVAPSNLSLVIERGFKAYQQGRFDLAKQEYDKALEISPRDRDALLGAAALATQQGRMQDAFHYYRLRISDAPDDPFARAGLLTIASLDGDDPGLKSSIEEMLVDSPDTAYLHFLKGSIYAAANEWNPAQSAFFDAYNRERSNPDYAYNLAVSMDHLNQPEEARRYYQEALRLGADRKSNFESEPVRMRLNQLQGVQQ